jgi:hypothetical protein
MAVCIACGTENRDKAVFCRGCATSLIALPTTATASATPAPDTSLKGPTQDCPVCQAKNPLVATSCKNCKASLVPDMAIPKAVVKPVAKSSGLHGRLAVMVGLVLVTTAVGAWWLGSGEQAPVKVAAVAVNEQPQALGVDLVASPPPLVPAASEAPPTADELATAAAAEQGDRIKKQAAAVVEADRKRRLREKRDKEARELALAEQAKAAQAQAQRQAELDRQRAEEAARQQALAAARAAAPPPPPVRTVDMVCGDSANFIAREVCRTRECRNPGFAKDPVCVRFREVEAANLRQPQY